MTKHSVSIRRRSVLKQGVGAFGLLALIGCTGDTDDDAAGDDDEEETDVENDDDDTSEHPAAIAVETVADGLSHPWAISFVPDEPYLLVTEREQDLVLVSREDGDVRVVEGTPEAFTGGQGGLLDIALHPDYPDPPWVYITYSVADDDFNTTTAVGRGQLNLEESRLEDFDVLHEAEPWMQSNGHFGSRVIFGPDEHIYVTIGDRQEKDFGPDHVSQDTSNELGTTLRLSPDGSVPDDNPFVDEDGYVDSIYSYGHRNAQGMTLHPETDEIWQSEHGEQDGDEINVIERGGNFGWPIATYGCTYDEGSDIGEEPHERDDVVDPVYYWECNTGGFPPAGMTFYDGDVFSDWHGDLFVGNLAGQYLGHFRVDGHDVEELEPLLAGEDWRIRDVAVAPDTEYLYVAVDDEDAPIVRLVPGE